MYNSINIAFESQQILSILYALKTINAKFEDIEKIFEIMIPDEKALEVMMKIAIERKDSHRLLSYFDMIINMLNKLPTDEIIIRSLDFLINEECNLHFSFLFLENCIRSSNVTIDENVMRDYLQLIEQQFTNGDENEYPSISDVKLLKEIVTDLPAHLKLLNIEQILPDVKLQRDLYPKLLYFFMTFNISENISENENNLEENISDLELDGNAIVYDLLSHWISSYYISRDLWIDKELKYGDIQSVLNLNDWSYGSLSVLFTFMILEQNGQSFLDNGYYEVFVLFNEEIDIEQAMDNLQNMYDHGLEYKSIENYPGIVAIDLQSWNNSVNPVIEDEQIIEEYDSDSDGESFFLPLQQ